MSRESGDRYLANEVLTATPVRLRLMLIEGAIRFATQAKLAWQTGDEAAALASLGRAREVVAELYGSAAGAKTPLGRQIASIYLFLFRTLADAALHRAPGRIDGALRVLRSELATWQRLANKPADVRSEVLRCDGRESAPRPVSNSAITQGARLSFEA
jgi:flagellar protein FliS